MHQNKPKLSGTRLDGTWSSFPIQAMISYVENFNFKWMACT